MSRTATVILVVGAILVAAAVAMALVPFVLDAVREKTDPRVLEARVARAEAAALAAADETAGDAVGFLLLAAHDGDEAARDEARAFAAPSVPDATLVAWARAARGVVAADPASVHAEVLRSRLELVDGRDVAHCEVTLRADGVTGRADVVLERSVVATPAGDLDQWAVVELVFR